MEIRIDKSTLPQKEKKLKFRTDKDETHIGLYEPQDGIFTYNDGDFISESRVISWEYMDGITLQAALRDFGKVTVCGLKVDSYNVVIDNFKNTIENASECLITVMEHVGDKFTNIHMIDLKEGQFRLILKA